MWVFYFYLWFEWCSRAWNRVVVRRMWVRRRQWKEVWFVWKVCVWGEVYWIIVSLSSICVEIMWSNTFYSRNTPNPSDFKNLRNRQKSISLFPDVEVGLLLTNVTYDIIFEISEYVTKRFWRSTIILNSGSTQFGCFCSPDNEEFEQLNTEVT
jgi:hypothetical protein